MTKLKTWLGGLLVLQLVIAAALYWNSQQQEEQAEQGPLLSFESQQVDRIAVTDGDNSVTLVKTGDEWQIRELNTLPASGDKVTGALNKLGELRPGWPVATTDSSHTRFEVTPETFQRRIQLYRDDQLMDELYVGTSPGFRKVHVRRQGDDEVYAVELGSYTVPAAADEWLDSAVISVSEVNRIEGPDYALVKNEDDWRFAPAATGGGEEKEFILDVDKARQLATALTTFRVVGVAETTPEVEPLTLKVSADGAQWTYEFYQTGDQYFVRRNDRDIVFKVGKYDFDRITGVDHAKLAVSTGSDSEESSEAPSASSS